MLVGAAIVSQVIVVILAGAALYARHVGADGMGT